MATPYGRIPTKWNPANIPEQVTVQSEPTYIAELDYDGNGNLIYIGSAAAGTSQTTAGWQIRQLNYSGNNPTSVLLANGSTSFNQVWSNRASLSYS